MSDDEWLELVPALKFNSSLTQSYFVLRPDSFQETALLEVEHTLKRQLPRAVHILLQNWNEQGYELLLKVIPYELSLESDNAMKLPEKVNIELLFPELCSLLKNTKEFAVIINPTTPHPHFQIIFAGLRGRILATGQTQSWAYYMPQPLHVFQEQGAKTGTQFDTQLKLLYRCMYGSPNEVICPYIFQPEMLEKGLLIETYEDLQDSIPLSHDLYELLKDFVVLYQTVSGDSIGFFSNERREDGNYTIFMWEHGKLQFTEWASDLASAMRRKLLRY